MNLSPGRVDPDNTLLPFAHYDRLHVARFVILQDETLGDLAAYGVSFPNASRPGWCSWATATARPMTCCGVRRDRRAQGCARSSPLRRSRRGLICWTGCSRHFLQPAAQYVNWVGRTVQQIREEAALHDFLRECLAKDAAWSTQSGRDRSRSVDCAGAAADPVLSPPAPTPHRWQANACLVGNITCVAVGVLLFPILLLLSPLFLWLLRVRERRDPVITPRPTAAHVAATEHAGRL